MKFKEKLFWGHEKLLAHGPLNVVVFGDSVTQGCFDRSEVDYRLVYWRRLEEMLLDAGGSMPINMINCGIGGTSAHQSLARIERDLTRYQPDLLIVSFGLNDVNGSLQDYGNALRRIYQAGLDCGSEVIHLTQNMLNTRQHPDTEEKYRDYAKLTADMQNSGKMDAFVEAARQTAGEMGIYICDAYKQWKAMQTAGVDTDLYLCNHINHPTRTMHALFAAMLYNLIMGIEA